MHRNLQRWLLPVAFAMAVMAAPASAQDRQRAASLPDPLDAQATVPPIVHRSTLGSYRRPGDDKPVPWRDANDTVGRIGGWRAYARESAEAAQPTAPERTAPAAAGVPVPAPAASAPGRPLPAGHGGPMKH